MPFVPRLGHPSAMLEAGVHVKAVSDSLGHSSAQITLDIYGFTADKVARAAADRVGGLVRRHWW